MKNTRTVDEYNNVMELLKLHNMKEVSKITGIPWSTIKNWKSNRSVSHQDRYGACKKKNVLDQINNISKVHLQVLLDTSTSLSDALKKLDLDYTKPFYLNALRNKIVEFSVDLQKMEINKNSDTRYGKLLNSEIFTEKSKIDRSNVRRRIVRDRLLEHRCAQCPIVDEYNGKKISLQLDHINGVRNDHRLENLRWLCPNCHSQQETSFGKRRK
jgi:transposase/Zn finger protein HypA/HybF involved in hydrogenase expression